MGSEFEMNFDNKRSSYLAYDLQLFAKDGPGGEKTEPATAKKLRDAREEGKVARSKELITAFELLALFLILKIFMSMFFEGFSESFVLVYNRIPSIINDSIGGVSFNGIMFVLRESMKKIMLILAPVFAIAVLVSFVISVAQVKWKPTTKPMKPKLEKLNPINGFKKMFSMESLFELVKSIVKIILISIVAYSNIKKYAGDLFILYDIPMKQAISLIGQIIIDTGIKIAAVYIVIGIADYAYNKHKFNKEMRMTKQEVKEEFKQTEGSPEVKGRQRQIMRQASQRRMMQDVPKADVIITNPTHISVALSYDTEVAKAPIVLAKGEDYLALKIREVAKEHSIEIVENKPLARMLYANVDVGQEIPPELYQAVAEVLASIYNKR